MPRVALFVPCYVDYLAPQVGLATAELLEAYGCEVDFPEAQACCGQPMANLGCHADARPLALRFAKVFDAERYDHVVAPSGSCVAMVRHHYGELARGAREREALIEVGRRTRELCEFLVDVLEVEAIDGRYPHRVGLHHGCHGLRELGLGGPSEWAPSPPDKVGRLLESIDGLELIELERRDECCGFGGSFAVSEEAVSLRMGRDRLADHARGGAEVIVSTDVSCSLHLASVARSAGNTTRLLHVAELMNEARKALATR
ncbi:MAG: (Fe-S)-binding protein [Myxococcota bacterium]|nr:(Fe-S)-binding protein [Myxococcota bacterium]